MSIEKEYEHCGERWKRTDVDWSANYCLVVIKVRFMPELNKHKDGIFDQKELLFFILLVFFFFWPGRQFVLDSFIIRTNFWG
ncbi:hypothetical protein EUGRSUZ_E01523 [Eucalyptus grandis]|uniref:Uncharacterized protein n=2 Tax=Eucalyptus grandis TaxID=71139 RepID=A0ACC3KVF3_EUCGR|nr:hypothetical protein EUGRSUZ_E01523 [Eucalyptus grandis]